MIDIYDKTGDREAYRAEIARLVFGSVLRNLEYIWKLKEACEDEEWMRYREEILGSRTSGQIRLELMEKEGLFQRLFCEIRTCGSISVMNQYEKTLKKHFPEEMRDWYAEYVKKEAGMAADRNRYRELMKVLRKLSFYPDGEQVAEKIAMEWRKEYKRRPAMMQELEKAGF